MSTDAWRPGDQLAELALPPVTRATLRAYAEASGDRNPIHLDPETARAAGFPDVIAHGMLVMAYLGRCLTFVVDQRDVETFSSRFVAMTRIDDAITCRATVTEIIPGEKCRARLELVATDQAGEIKAQGHAVVLCPHLT